MNFVIKERSAADILPISPIIGAGPGTGTPTVSLAVQRRKLDTTVPGGGNGEAVAGAQSVGQTLPPIVVNEEELEDEYMKTNHVMMSAMSEEELLKHVEELRLSVSAKSMEVMQSDKFKRKVGLLPSTSESGAGGKDARGRPPLPSPPHHREETQGRQTSLAWSRGDFAVSMPNSLEELEALQKTAPSEWRRQIEWTIKKEEGKAPTPQEQAGAATPSLFARSLNRSKYDRFALDGSKVVDKRKTAEDLCTVLSILGLSQDATASVSALLIEKSLQAGFCVEPNAPDTQPQDELLQHEQDPDEPGYSFMEISEMFRSEEKHQRNLAINMLSGILRKRDAAVSLEPYCALRLTPETRADSPLVEAFEHVCGKIVELMRLENVWEGVENLSHAQMCYLRRVVTFAWLFLCSADFPTALPTLLLWGLQLRMPLPSKLNLFRCLQHYLYSQLEEVVAGKLWVGLWGVYGCPALQTPHDRRMEVPYEEYVAHCLMSRDKEIDAENATDNPLAPPSDRAQPQRSVQESFAMRNRWGRVDAMVQDGDLCQLLSNQLLEAVVLILDNKPEPSIAVLLESSFFLALTVLQISCAIARIGDKESVDLLIHSIVKRHWGVFSDKVSLLVLLPRSAEAPASDAAPQMLALWFRLLAEICRRDCEMAEWVASQRNFMNFLLSLVLHARHTSKAREKTDSEQQDGGLVWGLRLWRVLLAYGLGLETVSELLLAAQMPRIGGEDGHAPRSPSSSSPSSDCVEFFVGAGLMISGSSQVAEFLCLLEQASVTCAAIIRSELEAVQVSRDADMPSISPRFFAVIQLAQMLISVALSTVKEFRDGWKEEPGSAFVVQHSVKSNAMHFVASVLGLKLQPPAEATQFQRRLAQLFLASMIRGQGLAPACRACVAQFRQQRSVDARVEHVDGVAESFVAECAQAFAGPQLQVSASGKFSCSSDNTLQEWQEQENALAVKRLNASVDSYRSVQVASGAASGASSNLQTASFPAPKATEGLLTWQRYRLHQAHALCSLQAKIIQAHSRGALNPWDQEQLSSDVMIALSALGQSLIGPAMSLISFLIDGLLDKAVAGNSEIKSLRQRIIIGLFCVSAESEEFDSLQFEARLSLNTLSGANAPSMAVAATERSALCDWVQLPFNPKLPLSNDWYLRCLPSLSGHMFDTWISIISVMEGRARDEQSAAAGKLCQILKLAGPDASSRWFTEDSPMEASRTSVSAFCSLVAVYFTRVMAKPSGAREAVTEAADGETFASSRLFGGGGGGKKKSVGAKAADAGLMELCDKLLEASMVPSVDHDVHCSTLLLLVCPLLASWKMQQKVWLELGNARCVHLMHGPETTVLAFVPYFVLLSHHYTIQAQTARAIIAALSQLRMPRDERLWPVCSMGIQQVVNFLLQSPAGPGRADKIALELLRMPCPDWLLMDICSVAAATGELQALLAAATYPSTRTDAVELGTLLVQHWDRVRSPEMLEGEMEAEDRQERVRSSFS